MSTAKSNQIQSNPIKQIVVTRPKLLFRSKEFWLTILKPTIQKVETSLNYHFSVLKMCEKLHIQLDNMYSKLADIKYSVQCIENRLLTKPTHCEDGNKTISRAPFGKQRKIRKSWRGGETETEKFNWQIDSWINWIIPLRTKPILAALLFVQSGDGGTEEVVLVGPLGRYTLYFQSGYCAPWKWSQSLLSQTTPTNAKTINSFNARQEWSKESAAKYFFP